MEGTIGKEGEVEKEKRGGGYREEEGGGEKIGANMWPRHLCCFLVVCFSASSAFCNCVSGEV